MTLTIAAYSSNICYYNAAFQDHKLPLSPHKYADPPSYY